MAKNSVSKIIRANEPSIPQRKQPARPQSATPGMPLQPIKCWRKAAPCPGIWERMSGTDQYRLSEKCGHFVYDLTGMDLKEAQRLVFKREGKINPTFYRRADGCFLTSNCPIGVKSGRTMLLLTATGLAISLFALASFVSHPSPAGSKQSQEGYKQDQAQKSNSQSSVTARRAKNSSYSNSHSDSQHSASAPIQPSSSVNSLPTQQRTASGFSWDDYLQEVSDNAQKTREESAQPRTQAGSTAPITQAAPQAAAGTARLTQSSGNADTQAQAPAQLQAQAVAASQSNSLILQAQTAPAAGDATERSSSDADQSMSQPASSPSNNNHGVTYYGK